MERIACVLDRDENYAVRIANYINNSNRLPITLRAFSGVDAYRKCASENEVELLLISSDILGEYSYEDFKDSAVCIVCLFDNNHIPTEEVCPMVKKYQAVDKLLGEIVSAYGESVSWTDVRKGGFEAAVVCIYSLGRDELRTSFGLTYSVLRAQNEQVLYLNLSEFLNIPTFLDCRKGTLSDALFLSDIPQKSRRVDLMSVVGNVFGMSYVAPVKYAPELREIDDVKLGELISGYISLGKYNRIVIEIGSLVKSPWDIMKMCDRVLFVRGRSLFEEQRENEFKSFLQENDYMGVLEKVIDITVDTEESVLSDGGFRPEYMRSTAMGRLVTEHDW